MAESDSEKWMHRLHVYGLDFRDLAALECFCAYLTVHYERLDGTNFVVFLFCPTLLFFFFFYSRCPFIVRFFRPPPPPSLF